MAFLTMFLLFSSFIPPTPCGKCWGFSQGFSKIISIWPNMVLHLLPFFLGSRYQRDILGKQEGGWPGEDVHHLQQGQRLAPTSSPRCGPAWKSSTLLAGQSPYLTWIPQGKLVTWGCPIRGFLPVRGLRNLAGAGQAFPTTPRAMISRLRLPYHLDGKLSWNSQACTENTLCTPTLSKIKTCLRDSACIPGSQTGLRSRNTPVNCYWYDSVW